MSNLINSCLKEISSNFNLFQMKKREYTKKDNKDNNKVETNNIAVVHCGIFALEEHKWVHIVRRTAVVARNLLSAVVKSIFVVVALTHPSTRESYH